jgi:hypothetical protein
MSIDQFNQLSEVEKEKEVKNNGTFISTHCDKFRLFDTYSYESFFVQFIYKINGSGHAHIRTFQDIKELNSLV